MRKKGGGVNLQSSQYTVIGLFWLYCIEFCAQGRPGFRFPGLMLSISRTGTYYIFMDPFFRQFIEGLFYPLQLLSGGRCSLWRGNHAVAYWVYSRLYTAFVHILALLLSNSVEGEI